MFRLSTGSGILLASLVVSLVLLYGQTKDRWNWAAPWAAPLLAVRWVFRFFANRLHPFISRLRHAISKRWFRRVSFAVVVVLVSAGSIAGILKWKKWYFSAARGFDPETAVAFIESTPPAQPFPIIPFDPKDVKPWEVNYKVDESRPDTWSFQKIRLGMKEEEVIAIIGKPVDSFGPFGGGIREEFDSKWLYAPQGQDGFWLDILKGVVIRIYMRSDQIAESTWRHWGLNRNDCPNDLPSLLSKFGEPSLKDVSNDGTVRTYFFDEFGFSFVVSNRRVKYFSIYTKVRDLFDELADKSTKNEANDTNAWIRTDLPVTLHDNFTWSSRDVIFREPTGNPELDWGDDPLIASLVKEDCVRIVSGQPPKGRQALLEKNGTWKYYSDAK